MPYTESQKDRFQRMEHEPRIKAQRDVVREKLQATFDAMQREHFMYCEYTPIGPLYDELTDQLVQIHKILKRYKDVE